MPLTLADRVRDTTTTTGTGTVTLSGTAPTGYQNFSVIGNGNTTYYTINAGSQWEVGIGTYSSTGPTLSRDTVLESSNANALVDFAAGVKDVFVTYPSDKSVIQDASGNVGIGTSAPGVTLDVAGDSIRLTRAANPPAFLGRQSNGTLASPTATASGNQILAISSSGYNGSAYTSTPSVAIRYLALESFTSTANGAGITFETTAIGSATTARAERMRIDGSGNVGIGTTAPSSLLELYSASAANFTVFGDSATNITAQRSSTDASGANLVLRKGRGTTASRTAVASGDTMGTLFFSAFGGTNNRNIATIAGTVGTYTSDTDISSNLIFSTTPTGSVTPAERMRIAADGTMTLSVGGVSNTHQFNYNESGGEIQLIDSTGAGPILIDNISGLARFYKVGSGSMSIGTTSTGVLAFNTNSAERMRIDSSGRLFVGATAGVGNDQMLVAFNSSGSITQALNLRDNNASGNGNSFFVLRRSDDTYLGALGRSGTDSAMFVDGNAYLALRTGGTERMRIDSSGNVGIGTSSPSQRLHVRQDLNGTTGILVQNRNGTGTPVAAVQFISGGFDLSDNRYAMISSSGGSSTTLQFWTGAGATPTERMRIDASGNVGIGTTTINARLSLGALVSNKVFALYDDGTNQYGMGIAGSQYRMFAATGANLCFGNYARSTDTFTETVRIDSSGNVGIGTSSPGTGAILDVQSTTKGVRFPNMTSTQKTAFTPAAGTVVFDTTLAKLCVYTGAAWQTISSL